MWASGAANRVSGAPASSNRAHVRRMPAATALAATIATTNNEEVASETRFDRLSCENRVGSCCRTDAAGKLVFLNLCCLKVLPSVVFERFGRLHLLEEIVICDHWDTRGKAQHFVQSICTNIPLLKKLTIKCAFSELPSEIVGMRRLETLELLRCQDLRPITPVEAAVDDNRKNLGVFLSGLKILRVRYCQTDQLRQFIRLFPHIVELHLGASCNDGIPEEIGTLANLESLTIAYSIKIRTLDLNIRSCVKLRYLYIDHCHNAENFIIPIHECRSLETLHIKNCPRAEIFASCLVAGSSSLRLLDLHGNELGSKADSDVWPDLWKFVSKCPKLQHLYLGNNSISSLDDFKGLLDFPSLLRTISISGNLSLISSKRSSDFVHTDQEQLVRILKRHCQLSCVDIYDAELIQIFHPEKSTIISDSRIKTLCALNHSGLNFTHSEQHQSLWAHFVAHFMNHNHQLDEQEKLDHLYSKLRNGILLGNRFGFE